MASYTFDGKVLKDSHHNKVGEVDGKYIKDSHYNRVGEIDGNYIKDSHYNRIAEVDGETIKDSHYNKIGTMVDVKKAIDGPGGITLAALWVIFVR